MISIVIRNKNEGKALEQVLKVLRGIYFEDNLEIILVDNNSTDNSIEIAKKFNCKIVSIENFTYGKATNLGIENASFNYVVILSSHAIPIGEAFFKNTISKMSKDKNIAGGRFINSFDNYKRALKNDFEIKDPLHEGLTTSCAIINKEVWSKIKFDESLIAIEDKDWSIKVINAGYNLIEINETFFYFSKRNIQSSLKRYYNETLAYHLVSRKKFPSTFKIIGVFFKKIFFVNIGQLYKSFVYDYKVLLLKLKIKRNIKKSL